MTLWHPDAPPGSAGSEDDEFDDSSLAGSWTEVDHGAVMTATEDEGGLKLFQATHAGDSNAGLYKAIPAGDFTYWTKVSLSGLAETNFVVGGIALWQDAAVSSGDLVVCSLETSAASGVIQVAYWNAYNTFNFGLINQPITVDVGPTHLYLRVRRTGATYSFDFSSDGLHWQRFHTTGSLGFTPAHIGPVVNNVATGADVAARFAFWRYIASDVGTNGLVGGDRIALAASPTIAGQIATAQASVLAPVVGALREVAVAGAIAAAGTDALSATIAAGATGDAAIAGDLAAAQAVALAAVVSATGISSVSGEVATAQASAIAAVVAAIRSPSVSAAIATALAEAIAADILKNVVVAGEEADAIASVRPADLMAIVPEPPIGSGGGGSTGGGSGSAGAGGSPAGFNWGACAIDFAIDLYVLTAQPFSIDREGPQHEFRTSPRGYTLPSLREGREWRFVWGESLVDTATVSELRQRLGTALRHRFTWTEPDGTPMDIIGSVMAVEYSWSQTSPGFYASVTVHVQEHER